MSENAEAQRLREKAAQLAEYAMSDVGGDMSTKRHAAGVDSRHKAAAEAERLLRKVAALEAAFARPAAHARVRSAPVKAERAPTLAQVHKREGVAPERARMEREVWAATHKDHRGYWKCGHTVMTVDGVVALRSLTDEEMADLHARRVRREVGDE